MNPRATSRSRIPRLTGRQFREGVVPEVPAEFAGGKALRVWLGVEDCEVFVEPDGAFLRVSEAGPMASFG